MKIFTCIVIFFLMSEKTFCQPGSNDYTSATLNWIATFDKYMNTRFGDTIDLRRMETGILYELKDKLYGSTERELYKDKSYTIIAGTDSRMKDFKLLEYIKNADGTWKLLSTINERSGISDAKNLMGDYEIASITPNETATYKFEIQAPSQEATARYSIILWSKELAGTTTSAKKISKTTYSIDNYSNAQFNAAKDAYDDFGAETSYMCLFEINSEETVVKQTESSGSTSVYYIQSKNYEDDKWIKYTIRSTEGIMYKFYLPKGNNSYIRVTKVDSNANNTLTDYHIKTKWTD
jgi:hypothetical protein